MRKAINDNPMVQIAVIGVLMVGVGLLFATSVLKKEPKGEDSTPSGADAVLAGTAAPTDGAAAPTLESPTDSATAAPASGGTPPPLPTPTAESLIPGPGLPAAVVDAWKGGQAVVLLIVRNKGVDDRLVKGSVEGLSSDRNIATFVAEARDAARYSRITQGVGVSRVPALIVIRPQKLSGSIPKAQVSYGFRNHQSVLQAVDDALYSGRDNIPYHPG
jgi:hypothetical protein